MGARRTISESQFATWCILSLQAGKPRSLGTGAVLIAWRCRWFYIKPLWLDVSLSSQNNELTSEIDFFAWMKSWSNLIWVSKVTPDFFLWCWNCILCSDCLGKKNSHCGQGFKQHQKEGFLCSLGEHQPFVQMKTEAVKSALLIRNVLNAILYHICTTTVHFSKPERTQHPG